jgi:hypothetical protein
MGIAFIWHTRSTTKHTDTNADTPTDEPALTNA